MNDIPVTYKTRLADVAMPANIADLPRDARGYPVPRFATWINGQPDFTVMDMHHLQRCCSHYRCWICGKSLGRNMAFVVGVISTITRVSSEPPSHLVCAEYATKVCPFLAIPSMKYAPLNAHRRGNAPGTPIEDRTGALAVFVTRHYEPFQAEAGNPGTLFRLDDPIKAVWYYEGRLATRNEVDEAMRKALSILRPLAVESGDGAVMQLRQNEKRARELLPAG